MNQNPYTSPEQIWQNTASGPVLRGPDYYYRPLKDLLLAHLVAGIVSVIGVCVLDALDRALESRNAYSSVSLPNSQEYYLKIALLAVFVVTILSLLSWHVVFVCA